MRWNRRWTNWPTPLKRDPLELRLLNYAETDPHEDKPFSSKNLRQSYLAGAEAFGWARRSPEPGPRRAGRVLIGWGMATATYPTNRPQASARIVFGADGDVIVQSGIQDLGTGTYTVMAQVAADALKMPLHRTRFELADSNFPKAPASGGSQTAASVGPAALEAARQKLCAMALADGGGAFAGYAPGDLESDNNTVRVPATPTTRLSVPALLTRNGMRGWS